MRCIAARDDAPNRGFSFEPEGRRFLRRTARFAFGFGGGCSATQLRRRSHQMQTVGGASGPPTIRVSNSRGSTGWGAFAS